AGTITGWTVNWGDGVVQSFTGSPLTVTHSYADGPNAYTILASATAASGTYAAAGKSVTVNNVAPTLLISGAGSVPHGDLYTLHLAHSDSGSDTIASWTIDWGDGTTQSVAGDAMTVLKLYGST